jgi:hypothetical protein
MADAPTQHEMQTEARLTAIELILERLMVFSLQGLTDEEFEQQLARYSALLDKLALEGLDAATSDHVSGELQDTVHEILANVRRLRRQSR